MKKKIRMLEGGPMRCDSFWVWSVTLYFGSRELVVISKRFGKPSEDIAGAVPCTRGALKKTRLSLEPLDIARARHIS